MKNAIRNSLNNSITLKMRLLEEHILTDIEDIVRLCVTALSNGNSIYWCGNGGSAADAQHLAAELSGRFYYDRPPLPSDALHCNSSYMTAVANDYGYELVYSRLIKGLGKEGDVLIGLSTSGESDNIINAFKEAKKLGILTIGLTGKNKSKFNTLTDITINVPSSDTPRIQECHMIIGHIICELIENQLYPKT